MRRVVYAYLIAVGAFCISSFKSSTMCNPDSLKGNCIGQLADGFTYIKSYSLDPVKAAKGGKIEYSFVFSKGTNYMLTFANESGQATDVEIKLYDSNKKLLFSNFNPSNNKYYKVNYPCQSTGVHYMTFTHKNNGDCGLSVLGFKR